MEVPLQDIQKLAFRMLWSFDNPMRVEIKDGRGCRRAFAEYFRTHGILTFPWRTRNMAVICHEVSHLLTPYREPHGAEFCCVFLRVVREFMGPGEAARLLEQFQAHRVRLFVDSQKRRDLLPDRIYRNP